MDFFLIILTFAGLAVAIFLARKFMHSRHGHDYERIIAWGSRRLGPVPKPMDDIEIDNYVAKIQSTASHPLHEKTMKGLKKHLKKTHGS